MSTPKKIVDYQPSSLEDKENGPPVQGQVVRGSNQNQNPSEDTAVPISMDQLSGYFANWEKEKAQYEQRIKDMTEYNAKRRHAISQMRRNNAKTAIEIEQKEMLIKKYDESISTTEALLEPLAQKLLGLNVILSGLKQESNPEIEEDIKRTALVTRVAEKACVEFDSQFQEVRANRMNGIKSYIAEIEAIVNRTGNLKEKIEDKKRELNELNEKLRATHLSHQNDQKELLMIQSNVKAKKEEQIEKNEQYKQELESMKVAHEEKMTKIRSEIEVCKSLQNELAQEEEEIKRKTDEVKQKIIEQASSKAATTERIVKLQYENDERKQKILERLQRKLQLNKQKDEANEKKKLQDQKISSEKEANKVLLEAKDKEMELDGNIEMKKMLIGARTREIEMRKECLEKKENAIAEEQANMKEICEQTTDMKLEIERNEEELVDIRRSIEAIGTEKSMLQESMKNTNKAIVEIRNKKTTLMEELERLKMGSIDRLHSLFNTSKDKDKSPNKN